MLWDRLYRLKHDGVTLIITTHYMDEAEQLCDRLAVMDGGRIVAAGSPARPDRGSTSRVRCSSCASRRACRPRSANALCAAELGERIEVLPDRVVVYTDDGEAALVEVHGCRWRRSPRSCGARRSRTSS